MIRIGSQHGRSLNCSILLFAISQLPQAKKKQATNRRMGAFARSSSLRSGPLPIQAWLSPSILVDADDIHPRNKADVVRRLWRVAQLCAKRSLFSYSGPKPKPSRGQTSCGKKRISCVSTVMVDGALKVKGQNYWVCG